MKAHKTHNLSPEGRRNVSEASRARLLALPKEELRERARKAGSSKSEKKVVGARARWAKRKEQKLQALRILEEIRKSASEAKNAAQIAIVQDLVKSL